MIIVIHTHVTFTRDGRCRSVGTVLYKVDEVVRPGWSVTWLRWGVQPRISFAARLSMAVELADITRPVSFAAGSTFSFFGLVTLFGGGAAVAKLPAAPARVTR